jgi:hypothetical protein
MNDLTMNNLGNNKDWLASGALTIQYSMRKHLL